MSYILLISDGVVRADGKDAGKSKKLVKYIDSSKNAKDATVNLIQSQRAGFERFGTRHYQEIERY
jgi:hypothetical protein